MVPEFNAVFSEARLINRVADLTSRIKILEETIEHLKEEESKSDRIVSVFLGKTHLDIRS